MSEVLTLLLSCLSCLGSYPSYTRTLDLKFELETSGVCSVKVRRSKNESSKVNAGGSLVGRAEHQGFEWEGRVYVFGKWISCVFVLIFERLIFSMNGGLRYDGDTWRSLNIECVLTMDWMV